jgi:hypothetical protein
MSEHVVGAGSDPRDALASLHEFQQLSAGTTYADAVHRLLAAVRTQLDMQPAALRARPAAPDGVTVARLAAVDDARVGVPAERAAHGLGLPSRRLGVHRCGTPSPHHVENYIGVIPRCCGTVGPATGRGKRLAKEIREVAGRTPRGAERPGVSPSEWVDEKPEMPGSRVPRRRHHIPDRASRVRQERRRSDVANARS